MRVIVISNMYPDYNSPNYGVFVKNFIDNLKAKSDFKVDAILLRGKSKSLLYKIVKYISFYFQIYFQICFSKPDLVYIHYANHSLIPFLLIPERMGKSILNFHGSDLFPESLLSKTIQVLTKSLVRKSKGIVVPSDYFKDEVSSRYRVDIAKIFVSPSGGINRKIFMYDGVSKSKEASKIVIGYFGRLDVGKGFEMVVSLAEKVNELKLEFLISVIGWGDLANYYIDQIKEKGLYHCFQFHGFQTQSSVPVLLKELDVLVFPSYRKGESLGLVGLEAMSCGIPVIGSDSGGISSYIMDSVNGYLFKAQDSNDLFRKFLQFLNLDYENKLKMAFEAAKKAEEYDSEAVNIRMVDYLKKQL